LLETRQPNAVENGAIVAASIKAAAKVNLSILLIEDSF
jgi:hypothetical protein